MEAVFCCYLMSGHRDKTEEDPSYLGAESLALCEASSVELTYSLTYTNPLNQEPQLGSEVKCCIVYIVYFFFIILYYIS